MFGLCTKHCTWIVIIAMAITLALQPVTAPLHIPAGGIGCAATWHGWPLGYVSNETIPCMGALEKFLNYFVNGFANILIFFFPLRLLHDRFMHRRG